MLKTRITLIGLLALAVFFLNGCGQNKDSGALTSDGYTFAKTTAQGKIEPTEDNTFTPGSDVHIVLKNVKTFKADQTGKHRLDIDLIVLNSEKKEIFSQEKILGNSGVAVLEQGIADTPYGTFHTSKNIVPGTYTIQITLHDLVAKTSLRQEANFVIAAAAQS